MIFLKPWQLAGRCYREDGGGDGGGDGSGSGGGSDGGNGDGPGDGGGTGDGSGTGNGAGPGDGGGDSTDSSSSGATNGSDSQSDAAASAGDPTDASSSNATNGSDSMSDSFGGGPSDAGGFGGMGSPDGSPGFSFSGLLDSVKVGLGYAASGIGLLSGNPLGVAAAVTNIASGISNAVSNGSFSGSSPSAASGSESFGGGGGGDDSGGGLSSPVSAYKEPLTFSRVTPLPKLGVSVVGDKNASESDGVIPAITPANLTTNYSTSAPSKTDWITIMGIAVSLIALYQGQ